MQTLKEMLESADTTKLSAGGNSMVNPFGGTGVERVSTSVPLKRFGPQGIQEQPKQQEPVQKPIVVPVQKQIVEEPIVKKVETQLYEAPLNKDVLICQPMYKVVDPLVCFVKTILFDKETMGYATQMGDAMIVHTRNHLADVFMRSKSEWLLFWDDDMIPPCGRPDWSKAYVPGMPKDYPESFLKINPIARLKSHGKTVIGGLYFGRRSPHGPICSKTPETLDAISKAPCEEIIPVDWVGTGFLLIHRSVFEAIQKNFPELSPKHSHNAWERIWDYFHADVQGAEDVSFCARAKQSGHQPYVDLSTVIFHLGTAAYGPWSQGK
jgi:hypothetical protein